MEAIITASGFGTHFTARDAAGTVAFLASPAAPYTSGQVVRVNSRHVGA